MSTLDPEAAAFLAAIAQLEIPDISTQTPEDVRARIEAAPLPPGPDMACEDRLLQAPHGELPVRIYRPRESDTLPCFVWFHGGGFVVGSVASYDAVCREIAAASGCAVVSVEYRLAPEHPFPAAIDDAVESLRLLARDGRELGLDPERMAVGGDSAGGNLATVAAGILASELPLRLQVLVYPATDLRAFDTESHRAFAEGHYLTRTGIEWFRDHYLPDRALTHDPRVSPLAGPIPNNLPEALIITAGCDILRDEGEAYARALEAAGIPTTCTRYEGTIHAFITFYPFLTQGRKALHQIATALKTHLGT